LYQQLVQPNKKQGTRVQATLVHQNLSKPAKIEITRTDQATRHNRGKTISNCIPETHSDQQRNQGANQTSGGTSHHWYQYTKVHYRLEDQPGKTKRNQVQIHLGFTSINKQANRATEITTQGQSQAQPQKTQDNNPNPQPTPNKPTISTNKGKKGLRFCYQ
jgi:hypothetical protein